MDRRTSIFGRIKSWGASVRSRLAIAWQDVQIELDFLKFEREARKVHESVAEKQFSTSTLERELRLLQSKIDEECAARFGGTRKELAEERISIKAAISEHTEIQAYLQRDYRSEIEALVERKSQIIAGKKAAHAEVQQRREAIRSAYDRKSSEQTNLNYHAGEVRDWHTKSKRTPWLFGNGGRKLPKHSIFGQSFGDLESAKYKRDLAYDAVQAIKREISDEKSALDKGMGEIEKAQHKLDEIFKEIEQIRSAERYAIELRREGHTKGKISARLQDLRAQASAVDSKTSTLDKEQVDYRSARAAALGLSALETQVVDIKTGKAAFLATFDSEGERKTRMDMHRQAWLARRGEST